MTLISKMIGKETELVLQTMMQIFLAVLLASFIVYCTYNPGISIIVIWVVMASVAVVRLIDEGLGMRKRRVGWGWGCWWGLCVRLRCRCRRKEVLRRRAADRRWRWFMHCFVWLKHGRFKLSLNFLFYFFSIFDSVSVDNFVTMLSFDFQINCWNIEI